MKLLLLLIMITGFAHAATCTPITRTNYTTGQVLTSAALNADLNQLVTGHNTFDGGCVTDGTLEFTSLNTTDFAAILNGVQQGCKVTYSDSNTVLIDKCMASVNGSFVRTSTVTSVTWGCSGCASETASTSYYIYIKNGSSGSTLTPLISTSAPNNDGYDSSNNKVVAKLYNNASSDIDQYSIDMWVVNKFVASNTGGAYYTPTYVNLGTVSPATNSCLWARQGAFLTGDCSVTVGTTAAGIATISLPSGLNLDTSKILIINNAGTQGQSWGSYDTDSANIHGRIVTSPGSSTTVLYLASYYSAAGSLTGQNGNIITSSIQLDLKFRVPIKGWSDY